MLSILMVATVLTAVHPPQLARFSADTATVFIVGNRMADSVVVEHLSNHEVRINGYRVFPFTERPVTTPSSRDLARRALIREVNRIPRSNDEAVAFLNSSDLVDSAWTSEDALYLRWVGSKSPSRVMRGSIVPAPTSRSQEFFDLLVAGMRQHATIFIGEYFIAIPAEGSITGASDRPQRPTVNAQSLAKQRQAEPRLDADLVRPRDLTILKAR